MADRKSGTAGFSPADFAGVGIQFALSILLFLLVGKWIDGHLGTTPLFLILGAFVGAAAGFYSMYRKVAAATRKDAASREGRQ